MDNEFKKELYNHVKKILNILSHGTMFVSGVIIGYFMASSNKSNVIKNSVIFTSGSIVGITSLIGGVIGFIVLF